MVELSRRSQVHIKQRPKSSCKNRGGQCWPLQLSIRRITRCSRRNRACHHDLHSFFASRVPWNGASRRTRSVIHDDKEVLRPASALASLEAASFHCLRTFDDGLIGKAGSQRVYRGYSFDENQRRARRYCNSLSGDICHAKVAPPMAVTSSEFS